MAPWQSLTSLRPVRNVDAGDLLESFLVYGIASILGIRIYLELTGYPQVGGSTLHIAHMLYGGLFMLIAIVLLIAFLGKGVVRFAAVLGGLGFGIFIDELGKFITKDNDYFFKPTFSLIYILFVILFLVFRAIERRKTLTPDEALVNAVDIVKELVRHDLDDKEKEQALQLLQQSDRANPLVPALESMLRSAAALPNRAPGIPTRLARWGHRLYYRVIGYSWFATTLVVLFVLLGIADIIGLVSVIMSDPNFRSGRPHMSFVDWGDLVSSFLFGALIVIGIAGLRRSRTTAYHWFKRAILVSIFLSQVFSFYSEQLLAVIGVAVDLLLLGALNYTISEEQAGAEGVPITAAPPAALTA